MSVLSVISRKAKPPAKANRTLELVSGEAVNFAAAPDDGGLPTFEMIAYTGGEMNPGWGYPVVISIEGMKVVSQKNPVRLQHRTDQGVGHTDAIGTTGGRITAAGVISRDTESAREVVTASLNGFPWQASVGISVKKHEFVKEDAKVKVNGQTFVGPLFVVNESILNEISFVELGADRETTAKIAAEHNESGDIMAETMTLEDRERRCGLTEVAQLYGRGDQEIEAAFANGDTPQTFEIDSLKLNAIRDARPNVPGASREMGADAHDAGVSALLNFGQNPELTASLGERAATEGAALFKKGGGSWSRVGDLIVEAGASTNSIINEAVGRIGLDVFQKSPEAWRLFAHKTSLGNFGDNKLTQLAGTFKFTKVGEGGELKHSDLADKKTLLKLGTCGTILSTTRQAKIDDNIGLLLGIPAELAAEAARSVGDDLFTLLNGEAFWTTGLNQIDGASSALSIAGYGAAVERLRLQTDSSGRRLNLEPRWLIVGADLEATGRQILGSTTLGRDDEQGTTNPWVRSAELLVDARVQTGEWFLSSSSNNAGAVVGLLNGRDAPVVEEVDSAPELLGTTWRAYFDYGCALHESRAIIRSLGQ